MNHSITCHYISGNNLGYVHGNTHLRDLYLKGRTVGCLNSATLHVLSQHLAGNHVVCENRGQLFLVLGFQ